MAIEALYPSRRQSQRHNPLFARERRLHRIGMAVGLGVSILGFLCLRNGPSGTAAEAMDLAHLSGQAPAHASLVQAASTSLAATGEHTRKHVRIIPLYRTPTDAAL
jgi:hypothetical protein